MTETVSYLRELLIEAATRIEALQDDASAHIGSDAIFVAELKKVAGLLESEQIGWSHCRIRREEND